VFFRFIRLNTKPFLTIRRWLQAKNHSTDQSGNPGADRGPKWDQVSALSEADHLLAPEGCDFKIYRRRRRRLIPTRML
jgi:hypothetical protein